MTTHPTLITFDYDHAAPLDVQIHATETRDGVTIHDLTFASPKGDRVAAYLVLPPEGTPGPHPGILWMHWLEPHDVDSNRTEFLDEAVTLAQQGVISVLPDAFWTTTPAKAVGVKQFGWTTDYEHDLAISIKQVIEMRRALDMLLSQPGIDAERIGFVGHDFGGMYGALVAASDRRPKWYVIMAATYSFGEWFVFGSGFDEGQRDAYRAQIDVLDPARYIAQAAPAWLYFQFANDDFFVPKEAARRFFDAASEPKEIHWYDASHDLKDANHTSHTDRLAWIRRQLGLS